LQSPSRPIFTPRSEETEKATTAFFTEHLHADQTSGFSCGGTP
jgi:hypothetical protein